MKYIKSKFSDLPLGDAFIYNNLLYTKQSETCGISPRFGFFTIHPDEVVDSLPEPTIYLPPMRKKFHPALRVALAWLVVMGALYLIGEFCL